MNIAILGYGVEGQAAYEYWHKPENHLTVCDQDESLELPGGVARQLGKAYLHGLDAFDLIVRSPGILPSALVAVNSPELLQKVTSNCNEFFRVCSSQHIIGVTGTKGKGTTSTLIARMLEAAGKTVHLGGNIGVPPLTLLEPGIRSDDYVVLELSSFQLVDFNYSPAIGVCLMVVPEHLNWHGDFADYVAAKSRLFAKQTPEDVAIYFDGNETSKEVASSGAGQKLPYFASPGALVQDRKIVIAGQTVCNVSELKLLGRHNQQNACAAVTAVWQVTQNVDAIRQVLTTFAGLPHRLELIRDVAGVKFYNDSFAATPDAAIAALEAIPGQKVMIMGGFDRGLPTEHLAKAVKDHEADLRKVLLIGVSASRLAEEFTKIQFTNFAALSATSMPEIVAAARTNAKSGDTVVLSPGFASFDMFKNFEDRGQQYKAAVEQL